jgi:hypothetical protein
MLLLLLGAVLSVCPQSIPAQCKSLTETALGECICAINCSSDPCDAVCPISVDRCVLSCDSCPSVVSLSGCDKFCEFHPQERTHFTCRGSGECLLGSAVPSKFDCIPPLRCRMEEPFLNSSDHQLSARACNGPPTPNPDCISPTNNRIFTPGTTSVSFSWTLVDDWGTGNCVCSRYDLILNGVASNRGCSPAQPLSVTVSPGSYIWSVNDVNDKPFTSSSSTPYAFCVQSNVAGTTSFSSPADGAYVSSAPALTWSSSISWGVACSGNTKSYRIDVMFRFPFAITDLIR